jgi:transcription initiation factor TFIIIB Brf1 subunit/transcription initiation factor TFIIB
LTLFIYKLNGVCILVENENSLIECVEGNHEIILDSFRGEYVCVKCGLVLAKEFVSPSYKINPQDSMEQSNSGRHFVALGDRLNIVDGLGSYMGFQFASYFHDKNGSPLSSKQQALFKRLKYRYDLRARIDKQETDYRTLMTLNRICSMLEPINANIKNRAAYIYQKFSKNLVKGEFYNHLNLIAVCIYLAIKESKNNSPLTIKEIANAFQKLNHRVTTKSIIRTALKIKPKFKDLFQSHKTNKSEDYLSKIINKIISTPEIKKRLIKIQKPEFDYERALLNQSKLILQQISDEKRGGRNPYILAVATVYASDQVIAKTWGERPVLTQHLLSIITETAEYSVRDHWRGLLFNSIF